MSWQDILKMNQKEKDERFEQAKRMAEQGKYNTFSGAVMRGAKNYDEIMDDLTHELNGKVIFSPLYMNKKGQFSFEFKNKSQAKRFFKKFTNSVSGAGNFEVEPIEKDGEVKYYFVKQ
tara:strand:+ start:3778 stop:4131 length:354 start_codon:yes stop_codon:yes gene_type:complete